MAAWGRNDKLADFLRSNPDATFGDIADILEDSGWGGRSRSDYGEGTIGKILSGIDKIGKSIQGLDRTIMDMAKPWTEVDKAASKYAKTIGATKKGLEELRRASIYNVDKGHIAFDFGISADELIEAQESYIKGIGRSVKLGMDDSRTLAAIQSVFGDSSEMFKSFDKFGVSMEGIGAHMGKMFNEASKNGIALDKYAQNVKQGLEMANKYTFRDGLRGMEAMARRAAAIKMDMQQVESFAGAFDNIENALSNTAKLQVLGGQFAMGADALGILNDSLNDMESLQKRMEGFTRGIGTLNKETGEVEISTFNKLRLQQFANVTGQDFGKVMEVARRQSMIGEIEAQLNANTNPALQDENFKELIKNTATFKNGKAGVTVNGDFKELSKLTEKDQEELVRETQSQSQDIKDIAKDVRSLVQIREGYEKQFRNTMARTTARWVGSTYKGILGGGVSAAEDGYHGLTGKTGGFFRNVLYPVAAVLGTVGIGAMGIKRILNLWNVGGGTGSVSAASSKIGGGNIFKNIFRRGGGTRDIKTTVDTGRAATTAAKTTQVGRMVNMFGKEGTANILRTSRTIKGAKGVGQTAKAVTTGAKAMKGLKFVKGTGVLAGIAEGVSTGIDEFGTEKNYGTGKKIGRTAGSAAGAGLGAWGGAAAGAAIGSVVPVVGTLIGGLIGGAIGAFGGGKLGKWIGGGFANQRRRERNKEKLGLSESIQGDYSVKQLRELNKARATGKISKKLADKLLESGDNAMYEEIMAKKNDNKATRRKEREERRIRREERRDRLRDEAKQKIGVAHFTIGEAHFDGMEGSGIGISGIATNFAKMAINPFAKLNPISILRASKKEDGSSNELTSLKANLKRVSKTVFDTANKAIEKKSEKLNVKIDGKIKLETPTGDFDILKEIKKNPKLLDDLTQMIIKNMNTQTYGAYRSDRTFGNNIPYKNG